MMHSAWSRPFVFAALAVALVGACAHSEAGAPSPAKAAEGKRSEAAGGADTPAATTDKKPADEDVASESPKTASPSTGNRPVTPAPTPSPSPAPPAAEPDAPRRPETSLRAARGEVERAQRELNLAMNDCTSACRALGSMERATGHLCDLASDADDRQRCEDAKSVVLKAREKIRGTCRSCPNGPSLEKTAPIPSRP
jgi:hypothetical protein